MLSVNRARGVLLMNYLLLLPMPAVNTILYSYETSDWIGKGIVLLLVAISVVAWVVMIEKMIAVKRTRQDVNYFLDHYDAGKTPLDLVLSIERYTGPLAAIYQRGIDTIVEILQLQARDIDTCCREGLLPRALTEVEMARVKNVMERTTSLEVGRLERRLTVLGTCISVAPLLGLLGTVWGILVAFCQLAEKGRADISALAPGVAGALLTTVAGLLVAIPAAVGYNALVVRVQHLTNEMYEFSDEVASRLHLLNRD